MSNAPAAARSSVPHRVYEVLGLPIHDVNATAIVGFVDRHLQEGQRCRLLYVNAHVLNLAADPAVARFFQEAELVVCDGYGAALAVWALHGAVPSRQTPPDWVDALAARAAARSQRIFLLGSTPAACAGTMAALEARHPGLWVCGALDGYFDKRSGSPETAAVVEMINRASPDILLVGFGVPLQERWIWDNWRALDVPVVIAVGAMFDFLSGEVRRGPRWMTDAGFEWASRLVSEPRRLWRRYLVGLPFLAARLARARCRSKPN